MCKKLIPSACYVLLLTTASFSHAELDAQSEHETQSGYESMPLPVGPTDVSAELAENDRRRETILESGVIGQVFSPYFDWKRELNEEHDLKLGFSLYMLYQESQHSANNDTNAAGTIFRFQGSWKAFTLSDASTGSVVWRVENRSHLGGLQAPSTLGSNIAGSLNPGFAYSDNFDTDLSVLSWKQTFNKNTAGFDIGRLAFDVYLDAFAFQTFSRGFINRSFVFNPTMGTTGIGALGAVVKGYISDNIYIGAQIYDANAKSGQWDTDTVREGEWLKAVEIVWAPKKAQAKTDRIQLTYWHLDERKIAAVESGSGWVVSAGYQLENKMFPFVRFGHSDGGGNVVATSSFSGGIEVPVTAAQIFSIGLGWADLSDNKFGAAAEDETVLEASYKLQITKNFSFTPDFQYMKNPASLPNESSNWIAGVRGIWVL